MRLYYSYEEIKYLKVELSWQVDRINDKPSISKDMENLSNEIRKLLRYYNEVLNNLKPGEKVTDFQMVQEFNETEMYLKKVSKLLYFPCIILSPQLFIYP